MAARQASPRSTTQGTLPGAAASLDRRRALSPNATATSQHQRRQRRRLDADGTATNDCCTSAAECIRVLAAVQKVTECDPRPVSAPGDVDPPNEQSAEAKAEAERAAKAKSEAESVAKAEAERVAKAKAEAERVAKAALRQGTNSEAAATTARADHVSGPNTTCTTSCDFCDPGAASKQVIVYLKVDGMGSAVKGIVEQCAAAARLGWRCLIGSGNGRLNSNVGKAHHTVDGDAVLRLLFGENEYYDTSLAQSTPTNIELTVQTNFTAWLEEIPDGPVYQFMKSPRFELNKQPLLDQFLTPQYMSDMWRTTSCGIGKVLARGPNYFNTSDTLHVAAHLRRGDAVWDSNQNSRGIHLTHSTRYFVIAEIIKSLFPNAIFHAFTSCIGKQCAEMRDEDVPDWRSHGITLHVQDEKIGGNSGDPTTDWTTAVAHFASADIFLAGKSQMSVAAAYFNPNCVIWNEEHSTEALGRYISLHEVHADPKTMASMEPWYNDPSVIPASRYHEELRVQGASEAPFRDQLFDALQSCLNPPSF